MTGRATAFSLGGLALAALIIVFGLSTCQADEVDSAPRVVATVPIEAPVIFVPPPAIEIRAYATDWVNLRAGPTSTAASIGVVDRGQAVVLRECDRWCRVTVGELEGWVYGSYLTLVAPR